MADLAYKVIQTVEGTEKVADLSAKLSLAEQKLQALMDAERAAVQAGAAWSANVNAQAAAVGNLQSELQGAQRELKNFKADLAQVSTQAGYLIDDLQQFKNGAAAGMQAISNNIQPLLSAIPGMAAFAPYVAVAAIAVAQLYEHWDQLMGVFGSGKVKTESEEMEELAKNTKRTADEEARYQKLKENAKHADAQHDKTDEQSRFQKEVDSAIKNGPVSDIEKGIDKHYGQTIKLMTDLDKRTPEADAELADAQKSYDYSKANNLPGAQPGGALEKRLNDAKAAKDQIYAENRTKFLAQLPNNPGMVKGLADKAEANPGDFGPNGKKFAQDLKDAAKSPEQKKAEKDDAKAEQDAEDHFQKQEQAFRERQSKAEFDNWKKEEEEDAKAEEYYRKQEQAFEERKLKAEYDAWVESEKEKKKAAEKAIKDQEKFDKDTRKSQDQEATWANDDLMGRIDKRMGEIREGMGKNSEVTEGGASFAAKIQGGVSSDPIAKEQLKTLQAIRDILDKRNEDIQREAARDALFN